MNKKVSCATARVFVLLLGTHAWMLRFRTRHYRCHVAGVRFLVCRYHLHPPHTQPTPVEDAPSLQGWFSCSREKVSHARRLRRCSRSIIIKPPAILLKVYFRPLLAVCANKLIGGHQNVQKQSQTRTGDICTERKNKEREKKGVGAEVRVPGKPSIPLLLHFFFPRQLDYLCLFMLRWLYAVFLSSALPPATVFSCMQKQLNWLINNGS